MTAARVVQWLLLTGLFLLLPLFAAFFVAWRVHGRAERAGVVVALVILGVVVVLWVTAMWVGAAS